MSVLQAAIKCDTRQLRRLVIRGLSYEQANEQDSMHKSALAYACQNGLPTVVELLSCIPEIDPNIKDAEGNTPLILCAQAGHRSCINVLLNEFRNIDINAQNKNGLTALSHAAIQGRTECAKVLLAAGANPFKKDKVKGKTACEWAKYCGRQCCAELIQKEQKNFAHVLRHFVTTKPFENIKFTSNSPPKRWGSESDLTEAQEDTDGGQMFSTGGSNNSSNERNQKQPRNSSSSTITRSIRFMRRALAGRKKTCDYVCLDALVPASIVLHQHAVRPDFTNRELSYRRKIKTSQRNSTPCPPIPQINIITPVADETDEAEEEVTNADEGDSASLKTSCSLEEIEEASDDHCVIIHADV